MLAAVWLDVFTTQWCTDGLIVGQKCLNFPPQNSISGKMMCSVSDTAEGWTCFLSCVETNVWKPFYWATAAADAVSHSDEILCYLAVITSVATIRLEWIWYFPVVEIALGHWAIRPTTAGRYYLAVPEWILSTWVLSWPFFIQGMLSWKHMRGLFSPVARQILRGAAVVRAYLFMSKRGVLPWWNLYIFL